MKGIAVAIAVVALGGCGAMNPLTWWDSGPQEQQPQRLAGATRYQCAGGKELAVRFPSQEQAWAMVILPEREFRLDRAPSPSSIRYTNGRTTLIVQGEEAALEEEGTALFASCKRIT